MEKIEKILVPLDGSGCAEMVLPAAENLAAVMKADIVLLRVAFAHSLPGLDRTDAQVKVVREAEEYLGKLQKQMEAKGIRIETHVRYGDEAEEILDHASYKEITWIAMTTHGRSGIKRFLLGSVAEKVLRHSPKPIFLFRCV